jgi:hypothetical protein
VVELSQVYEDNGSRWERRPDGSFAHLPKQKQPPISLGAVRGLIAANSSAIADNAAAVSQNAADIAALQAAQEDTGWIAPTLLNGYTNYSGTWEQAGYRRINGVVHLRGLLDPPSLSGTPAIPAFVLPVGFRPAQGTHHLVYALSAPYVCQVMADGNVQFRRFNVADGPENISYVSLAGVTIVADQ